MQYQIGQALIDKKKRTAASVDKQKVVADTWTGGTQELYFVAGVWLTLFEVSECYFLVGTDDLPAEGGW